MPAVAAAVATAVTWVTSTAAAVNTAFVAAASLIPGLSFGAQIALANFAFKATTTLALSMASTALMQPRVGVGGSPVAFKADPAAPIAGVMGRFGVSGRQVHANTWGKDNLYMSFVVALSLGPIQSYETFTANTLEVTFPGAQGEAAPVEPYIDKMWQTRRLGLPTDAYLTIPTGVPDGAPSGGGTPFGEWTSAHTLPGFAHALWTLKNNSKHAGYESGVPKPVWTLHGMKLWDPRLDSTYPGGSGTQRRDDWSTWAYTENPYLHALAFTRGHYKLNTDGSINRTKRIAGVGAPDAAIDIGAFVEGANVADANDWAIAGEWTTVDDKWQVLAAMLQAGGGVPLNRGAQISCMVETPRTSLLTLTREDIVGSVSLNVMASRRDRPNTVIPRVRLEAQLFEEVALGAVTSAAYLTEDGEEPRVREVAYSYVGQAKQGAELAAYGLANARETLKASIPCKPHLLGLRAGDALTVTEPELGLNGQKFVVLKRAFDPAGATVTLDLRSETDAKHAWALGQVADPPETPSLTYVSTVTEPDAGDWTLTAETFTDNGTSIPALVLSGAVTNDNIDTVIFEYRPVTDPVSPWAMAGSEGPTVERKEITGLTPGTEYEAAVSYKRGPGVSERLVLGPVEAGAIVMESITSLAAAVQVAQATSNEAQATADEALGGGTVSGSATSPTVDIADETWVTGPQVDLTSVVAGNLTITGSGPQQDDDVTQSGGSIFNGQYRIVEIDGMTETTLFTGSFRVTSGTPATVLNTSGPGVADFLEARTSTGSISYRLDARRTSGVVTVQDLSLYLFARRAA